MSCPETYRGIDLRLHACARPEGHNPPHLPVALPGEPREYVETMQTEQRLEQELYERDTVSFPDDLCEVCGEEPAESRCPGCGRRFCTSCQLHVPPDAYLCDDCLPDRMRWP